MIEDMRSSFAKCEEYLSTAPPRREEDPEIATIRTMIETGVLDLSKQNVRRYLMKKLGIEEMDVKVAKNESKDEAFARMISSKLGIKPIHIKIQREEDDPKKIIRENELERYLAEGWDVQTVLPSGKILVRKS
ncbi:hypothetical protein CW705_04935 [Candidatus Bathyarchaeota archaeon]|nr:MAG: hypothetical protein CW705_04935 [Candidatus Bathyarchaeota archaeon]